MIGHGAIASAPLAAFLEEWSAASAGTATIEAADASLFQLYSGTQEFITEPDDTPGNQPIFGTLQHALRFERSIISSDGFGRVTIGWGEMAIINADGEYDDFIGGYSVDGRRVVLRAGLAGSPYSRFVTVFDGTAQDWLIEEDILRIKVRDNGYKLAVPAQGNLYGGTGGLDGSADLKGKRKPKAFGQTLNVTPALVDPARLLYQVHDGAIEAVSAVYDRGVALVFAGDYSSSAALLSAAIAPGHFSTCLTEGFFRLGAAPAGTVTADVEGDKAGGVYVTSVAGIVRRLVATTAVTVPDEIDDLSFERLDASQPARVGYWLAPDSNATVADVIADLMASIGGWVGFTRASLLQAGIFTLPDGAAAGRYDEQDIIEIERLGLPEGLSPPPWRHRVAWGRNWTVQQDLAGAVGAARVAALAEAFRVAEASLPAIKANRPLAQDPAVIEAYFVDQADAEIEAQRRLGLFSGARSLYRVVIKGRLFSHDIGDVVGLTYPRWNLTEGRLLRIVAVSEDTDSHQTQLTAFG
ncbi:hypothetical protein [Microvirga antarctica]|uniref:hypothetical protein n=1 Tax=Microvirga antarctica TaxID=2819233 RepID=UPI001B3020CD|nr:hypothetical protein [Microvirga antarctica]